MKQTLNAKKIVRIVLTGPIILYQKVISPWKPSTCIYFPTCSEYARRAVMHHGILKGFLLAVTRVLRCSGGLFTGGEDPVPDAFSFEYIKNSFKEFRRR